MSGASHIYLHQVLIDDPPSPYIQMAYLGVPHLSGRQADILAAGLEKRNRILVSQPVNIGSTLRIDCIGSVLAAFSPAVQYH